jgi:site-specific DNA-methyltransferase (adenine-specific)
MINLDNYINKIIHGDCLLVLKDIPQHSIDCIITDPPYGIEFMGKDWDRAVPNVEVWKQCLRVLKPGAFMFVMSSPRQDTLSQMIIRLQQAGFETGFTSIYWTYASGFPKAMNVSLAVDKQECRKQLTKRLGREPTKDEFNEAWKTFRKLVGKDKYANRGAGIHGKSTAEERGNITEPASSDAKSLNGSYGGFQPKPAVEVILVCMKPLSEKTYVEQALKNKKGITWLDNCRIPYVSNEDKEGARFGHQTWKSEDYHFKPEHLKRETYNVLSSDKGRFPANLLVSDDVLNDGKITESKVHMHKHSIGEHIYGGGKGLWKDGIEKESYYTDSGSFSRYFDLDKWFEKTFENLPESVKKTFPFLICPKASKSEREAGLENLPLKTKPSHMRTKGGTGERSVTEGFPETQRVNIHPTVKPIKLMSYLVTLGSREGDIILDPFVGSGTTCISAKMLNRKWIGIDCYPEYCEIASARLENCEIVRHDLTSEEKIVEQQSTVQPIEKPIEIKQKIKEEGIKCPKCGTKMYKGKKAYYCMKINCDGKIDFRKL